MSTGKSVLLPCRCLLASARPGPARPGPDRFRPGPVPARTTNDAAMPPSPLGPPPPPQDSRSESRAW
jgi:hypothetical protein